MKNKSQFIQFAFILLLIVGCQAQQSSWNSTYEDTKKVMLDVMKSDEGKKTILQLLKKEDVKKSMVLDTQIIKDTISTTFLQPEGKQFWKKAFQDPSFAKAYAKGTEDEQRELLKTMIHDPEYRGALIDLLHDQDIEKNVLRLLKSNDFQKHLKTVITQLLETPEMKDKLSKTIQSTKS